MNQKIASLALLAAAALFAACDDDTASMGIYDEADDVSVETLSFEATTRSYLLGEVEANTTKSYLGNVWDPETDTEIRAEFMAQFHTFENYSIPPRDQLVLDDEGNVICDSVDVRLYFTGYYGDNDNPMSVSAYELDADNVLREEFVYYSSTDIDDYIPSDAQPLARKTFAVEDYTLTDSERTSSTHSKNVRIILPNDYGAAILDKALNHPEFFTDSWQFIRNVCPGLAFKLDGGRGSMLTLDVSALNVYFRYTRNDSTYVGIARFAATPEVIQCTQINNSGLLKLLDNTQPYTYLKTPAAIATEVTLPVDEIYVEHQNDTISRARLMLQRYNSFEQSDYAFGPPSTLLLVVKDSLDNFFLKRKIADGKTSLTTSFSSSYNVYNFSNISRMVSFMHTTKLAGMASEGLTSEQWNIAHPDWNRAVLVPVVVKTVTNSSSGVVSQVSVTHDFSLSSTRIVGGTQPISIDVIYSSY